MPIQTDPGRQWILSAEKTVLFSDDFGAQADDGLDQDVIRLPVGARVIGGVVVVEEVWTNTAVIDVGDGEDPNRYTQTGGTIDLEVLGLTALDVQGFKVTALERDILLLGNFSVSDSTTGQLYMRIDYVIEGKVNEVQPIDVADYGSDRAA
jgi:hypothetical protein